MPPDELLVETPRDLGDVEAALFERELGMDRDLEQQVAELVAQPAEVAGVERLERLVGLLEQMRTQAGVRLLAVPGASVGRAQPLGDAARGRDRREVRVRTEGRQQRVARGERLRRERVAVVLSQQRAVGLAIEDEDDRPQGREGVTVERRGGYDVDAAGEALEQSGESRF
jgi:hypothetical protein